MGYQFDNGTQLISYGSHVELYQSQDLSVGFWIKFLPGVNDGKRIIAQEDAFPIIECSSAADVTNGLGIDAHHVKGGSFQFGVRCIPGAINPAFKLNLNSWLYFGISRSFSAMTYFSFFGSQAAMIDGQTFTWLPDEAPFDITQPGQVLGPWVVGNGVPGAIVGPAHYWSTFLTREQHLSMARCNLPTGVDLTKLLWWTKMFEGAADVSVNMWANTFAGTPLPTYVPDQGCQSFGTGIDYKLYNT